MYASDGANVILSMLSLLCLCNHKALQVMPGRMQNPCRAMTALDLPQSTHASASSETSLCQPNTRRPQSLNHRMQATGDLAPLGRFTLRNLWVVFTSTRSRKLSMRLSMPWVEGEDTRPWVPKEHSLVISSADAAADGARTPASLLTLQYAAEADMARQKIEVRRLTGQNLLIRVGWKICLMCSAVGVDVSGLRCRVDKHVSAEGLWHEALEDNAVHALQ